MTLNLQKPDITELKPRITVFGVGGGGGNAVNNMIASGLQGVEFVVANTDAQALTMSKADRLIQMGVAVTEGLGAGSQPEVGEAAAQECIDEIVDHLNGTHMAFVTAGMGGGTGTGAAPVVARAARDAGILTVGVVTKPFSFEGNRRMLLAEQGIEELQKCVDTLIVIPNQNLFRIADDKTTFGEAFSMADQVLYSGVACITDLMVKEGLINLDFADVRSVMREMGRAMMGTGESSGEGRAMAAAEAAISNPLLDETSMSGAQGLLISITGGQDMTLFEVDEAATRIREEVDADANIILGATFDETLEGTIRVSVVATGIESDAVGVEKNLQRMNDAAERIRQSAMGRATPDASVAAEVKTDATAAASVAPVAAAITQKSQAAEKAQAVEQELSIATPKSPAPAPVEAVEAEPEAAELSDPFSDAEFATALQEQMDAPDEEIATASAPRMPQPEDFSAVAQQELNRDAEATTRENGPKGLFEKLTNSLRGAPTGSEQGAVDHQRSSAQRTRDDASEGRMSGSLDQHGRKAANQRLSAEEDQLDIPAFLRRQAN
ncbi:MAG: cell division protein FtsZ [Ahrensia sp.]|nr:cell division protein FtsZ [Ahrensia sp.]